jgi:membrane protease YdiL (CAAX protease family)
VDFFIQVLALYSIMVGGIWFIGVRRHGATWESLGFRPVDLRSLGGLLGLLAGVILTANVAVRAFTNLPTAQDPFVFGREPRQMVLMACLVLVAAPLGEEVFFRGFLLQGLARRMRFWPAAVITSAIFAVAHVWPYLYLPIFVLGLALAWLFWRTGSIWASVAAHATINATSLLVAAFLYTR